jgi:conjugative relaxase-like TrwC/TraI family protein
VLSIGKIALGQHRYYQQQVARGWDDYYAGRGEAPGEWVGAGSATLGLCGRASSGEFSALIAARDPRSPALPLRCSAKAPTVAALDLTFSAPKSVSVLAVVGGEGLARELILAHEQALRAALGYLEETAVQVRRGHDGGRVLAGEGLVAVAYRHRMSRALDPQLHTHVVAANMTRGPDGRFTALHGAALYRAAKTAGYLYQAHLRALVSRRLGLVWGPVRAGAAEIEGVPEEVLFEFSKRRRQMERAAATGGIGLGSKSSSEAAALATRERKRFGVETHTWREEITARASALGLGVSELKRLVRVGRRVSCDLEGADEAALGDRLAGPDGLTANANVFDERTVLQAFAGAAAQGADVSQVRGQAQRFIARRDVIPVGERAMTSDDLLACERALVDAAVGRAQEGCSMVDAVLVDRAFAGARWPLTGEQAAAVRAVVSSGEGVSVIEALAGTGKTYLASVLRDVYESAGREVLGVAPTGRATRELHERAGISSRTLDRVLIDLERGETLPEGCVVILDEAGMAPTRASARLLQEAERAHAKVVAVGDQGQLSSVKAGGWLGAVGRRIGEVRLSEVMRQHDPVERRALSALHHGRAKRYLEWALAGGHISTFAERSDACMEVVAGWYEATKVSAIEQVVMIARGNDTRDRLNTAARELLRTLGVLGEQRAYGGRWFAVGERVICRRNDARLDVDNGTRGTLRGLDDCRVVIETDGGLLRELPRTYVRQYLECAYALTAHAMQGATVQTAFVVASPCDLTAGWSYTALSRARGRTRLFLHDEHPDEERSWYAPRDRQPAPTHTELLVRTSRRMLERDGEELATEHAAIGDR